MIKFRRMNLFRRLFGGQKEKDSAREAEPAPRVAGESGQEVDSDPVKEDGQDRGLLPRRVQLAVESLLDNEALGDELDDDAAGSLLQWGTAWAQDLAQATRDLDEESAREALEVKLREVRRMMRSVSRFAAQQAAMDEAGRIEALGRILERAQYARAGRARGALMDAIDESRKAAWVNRLADLADHPAQAVVELRKIIDEALTPDDKEPG